MTTMNNEDPADPSVHEPRVLDAADDPLLQPRVPNHVLECIYAYGDARADDDGNIGRRLGAAIVELRNWCADLIGEAIAAERGRGARPPKWWTCPTHGDAQPNAWGCPECVREMRSEKAVLEGWITSALGVLRTLESEDSEDGGEELRKLLDAGKHLVCKHPAKQIKNFTYGMRSHCPDCGHSEESWWD